MKATIFTLSFAVALSAAAIGAPGALAQEAAKASEAAYSDIAATLGVVPSHFKAYPEHAIAGAWEMTKSLLASPESALEPKVKSLINLAVAAQIPCQYCIWLETKLAKQQGATEQEVAEAVAQAAYVRHWSTVLNGMQIDFETFKTEFGGE